MIFTSQAHATTAEGSRNCGPLCGWALSTQGAVCGGDSKMLSRKIYDISSNSLDVLARTCNELGPLTLQNMATHM